MLARFAREKRVREGIDARAAEIISIDGDTVWAVVPSLRELEKDLRS